MLTRLRRRLGGEDGISLVEMLVAFVILGIAMSASASFFTTSLISLQQAEGRTKATALANEELERLRFLPWDDVGFYADDAFDGTIPADTVLLADARPSPARAPLPFETLDRAGVAFTVRRSILWIRNTQTSNEDDYKRLIVTVDWSDRGQARSITVDSLRSPAPSDQPASDFVLSLLEVAPDFVYINADGTLDSARNDQLDLTALTSAEADFVVTRYVQRGDVDETVQSLGSTDRLNWDSAVTSAHGHRFPNGDATFTFVATRALPYEQEVLGTTLVRFVQPVDVVSVALSPSLIQLTGLPAPSVDVAIEVDGLVEEDEVTVSWGAGQVVAGQVAATESGSSLTAQIPSGVLDLGLNTIAVTARRLSDGQTATFSTLLEVQLVLLDL